MSLFLTAFFSSFARVLPFAAALLLLWSSYQSRAQSEGSPTPPARESASATPISIQESRRHEIDSAADCGNSTYRLAYDAQVEDAAVFATAPNPDGAVSVEISLYFDQLTTINEVTSTYHIEGFLNMIWCDPRLAFDPQSVGTQEKLYLEDDAQRLLNEIWSPDPNIVNEDTPRSREDIELIVQPDGTVDYEERFGVEMEARYDLVRFPFDTQRLVVEIESFTWDDDYLLFQMQESGIGFSSEFEPAEWHVMDVSSAVESHQDVRDRKPFSRFTLELGVTRHWEFYVWKLLLPFLLLVILSWVVFWMTADSLSTRMGVSLTGILTVVAYQFSIVGNLPKVPYFTFTDAILSFSFLMTFATAAENMAVHLLQIRDRKATASRLDYSCRWIFPLVYFGGLIFIGVVYLH